MPGVFFYYRHPPIENRETAINSHAFQALIILVPKMATKKLPNVAPRGRVVLYLILDNRAAGRQQGAENRNKIKKQMESQMSLKNEKAQKMIESGEIETTAENMRFKEGSNLQKELKAGDVVKIRGLLQGFHCGGNYGGEEPYYMEIVGFGYDETRPFGKYVVYYKKQNLYSEDLKFDDFYVYSDSLEFINFIEIIK